VLCISCEYAVFRGVGVGAVYVYVCMSLFVIVLVFLILVACLCRSFVCGFFLVVRLRVGCFSSAYNTGRLVN